MELSAVLRYLRARDLRVAQDALIASEILLAAGFAPKRIEDILARLRPVRHAGLAERYGRAFAAEVEEVLRRQREFVNARRQGRQT